MKYRTWRQASRAARALGIRSRLDYLVRYQDDPELPSAPEIAYADIWSENDGWYGFLGKPRPRHYSYEEARAVCRRMGIRSSVAYQRQYRKDPRLPSRPELKYADRWEENNRWAGFLRAVPTGTAA